MKVQILPWLCLIMCVFVACHSIKGEASADVKVKAGERDDELEQQLMGRRGVEGVVHERKGAFGGSDINKKPPKNKNGATSLPVDTLGGITLCVFMVVNCFFLLL